MKSGMTRYSSIHQTAIGLGADVVASSMTHEADSFEDVLKSISSGALVFMMMPEPSIRHLLNKITEHKNARVIIASLKLVAAARSVNFICNFCREENREESVKKGFKVYFGRGCQKCHNTGCGDQSFIFEVLDVKSKEQKVMNSAIKDNSKLDNLIYDNFEVLSNEFYKEGLISL